MFSDSVNWQGTLRAYLIAPNWRGSFPCRWPKDKWPVVEQLFEAKNKILNAGRLRSYDHGFNFTYIAGGTGTVAPASTDTRLQIEASRFALDDLIKEVGQIDSFAIIPSGTGNITWKEWGLLMDDAGPSLGTGTLYSRLLQSFAKNLNDQVLLTYTLLETT